MTDTMLMYVKSAHDGGVELAQIAGSTGVIMPFNLPADFLRRLIGRHVWVKGNWGGECKILKWIDLPAFYVPDHKEDNANE